VSATIRTPYDDLPVETRRANWGWWGDPWPSGICYGDDGRLLEEMRKPFPAGEDCLYCGEPFSDGDSGQAMPLGRADGTALIRHVHKECQLREVLGPVKHLERACACFGGHGSSSLTSRQDALAVWEWVQEHGTSQSAPEEA
jgi:hypothetical protein